MLCKKRSELRLMLRIRRQPSGEVVVGGIGGRGVWICAAQDATHESDLRAAVSRGLRSEVKREEVDVIEQARRAWVEK